MMWVLAAVALSAIVWYWWRGMQPAPNDLESPAAVRDTLRYLLDRGVDAGLVRIQLRDNARVGMRFVKYLRGANEVGLTAVIPVDQQLQSADAIQSALVTERVKHERVAVPVDAIVVDCGSDIALAQRVLDVAFARVFARPVADGVAFFENVLISNKASLTGVEG